MKDRIGTALWVAGAIICAWALSVSLSMMFDFTIEEARQNFRGLRLRLSLEGPDLGRVREVPHLRARARRGHPAHCLRLVPAVRARTRRKPRSLIPSPARSRLPKRPFRRHREAAFLPAEKPCFDIEIFILIGLFSLVRTHKSSGELERAGKCNQILQIVRLFTPIGSKHRSCRSLQDSRISLMTLGRNLKTTTKRRAQSSAKRLILGKTLDQAQEFFSLWARLRCLS